jgi:hypothetical protein
MSFHVVAVIDCISVLQQYVCVASLACTGVTAKVRLEPSSNVISKSTVPLVGTGCTMRGFLFFVYSAQYTSMRAWGRVMEAD